MHEINKEIRNILTSLKNKQVKKLNPLFNPSTGFSYPGLENYCLEDQIKLFHICKRRGIFDGNPSESVIKCKHCTSYTFYTRFSCAMCGSHNIMRGTAIQHDICGNIDFENKYVISENTMKCEKCNKNLKAIGIDFSKINHVYKCMKCNSMLPQVDQNHICTQCGDLSTNEDLQILQLDEYTINPKKLDEITNGEDFLVSVIEELDRAGIKCEISVTLTGISKLQHEFGLVVYNETNFPICLIDTIDTGDSDDDQQSMDVLSFIAKCLDTNTPTKILVTVPPHLNKNLKALISSNKIVVIESNSRDEAAVDLIQTVMDFYNSNEMVLSYGE
jgi:hypothetical protein